VINEILHVIIPSSGTSLNIFFIYFNIVIFSIIFPNEILMFIVGFLVAMGKLNASVLLLIIATNTILSLFYYTISIKIKEKFLKNSIKLQKADDFFLKHGKGSIFIARFIPALRMSISFVAGVAQMNKKQFILYTIYGYTTLNGIWFIVGYFSHLVVRNLKDVNFTNFSLYSLGISTVFIIFYLINELFLKKGKK